MFILRFLIDGTRIRQLATDHAIGVSTAYENLWEGLAVLADCAPNLADAMESARQSGEGHPGLEGTLTPTNAVKIELLSRNRLSLLAMFGTDDIEIPVAASIQAFATHLSFDEQRNSLALFPNADHLLFQTELT